RTNVRWLKGEEMVDERASAARDRQVRTESGPRPAGPGDVSARPAAADGGATGAVGRLPRRSADRLCKDAPGTLSTTRPSGPRWPRVRRPLHRARAAVRV